MSHVFRCQPFFDATCELALEAHQWLHSCGRPRGVPASQPAGVIATHCNIFHLILSQTKNTSTLISILLEGPGDRFRSTTNGFSFSLQRKKEVMGFSILEKVEQIWISFIFFVSAQVYAIESLPHRQTPKGQVCADCHHCHHCLVVSSPCQTWHDHVG